MVCNESLIVTIACCTEQIILKAGLLPNTQYYWVIKENRFNNIFQKLVTTNNSGDLIIDTETDLPKGLINQYAGNYELKIKQGNNYLNTVKMLLMGEEHESVFFKCTPISNPVPLNSTISTEAIIQNPNNTNTSSYTQILLPIGTNGQTIFAIPQLIQNALDTFLFINGQERNYGVHYNISGTVLTWTSNNFTLETSDELVFYFK